MHANDAIARREAPGFINRAESKRKGNLVRGYMDGWTCHETCDDTQTFFHRLSGALVSQWSPPSY